MERVLVSMLGVVIALAGVRGVLTSVSAIRRGTYQGSRWDRSSPHSKVGAYVIWTVAGLLLLLSSLLSLGR